MVSEPRDGEQWDWDFGPRWRGSPSKGSPGGIEDEAGLIIDVTVGTDSRPMHT